MTRVWVTRSEPSGGVFKEKLEAKNIEGIVKPLFTIEAIESSAPVDHCGSLVVLSGHAARHTDFSKVSYNRVLAIGLGTQKTLREIHNLDSVLPRESNSESLLEYIKINQEVEESVVIVSGEDGRGLLKEELRKLGHQVFEWIVYRRVSSRPESSRELECCDYVEISSKTAMDSLAEFLTLNPESKLRHSTLVVPSKRIETSDRLPGDHSILVAQDASPTAMIKTIQSSIS